MELTIKLNQHMLAVIDQALQGAPYRVAKPVIDELNNQIAAMQKAAMPAESPYDDGCC